VKLEKSWIRPDGSIPDQMMTKLDQNIEMSFLHLSKPSQLQELTDLVPFFSETRGVEHIRVQTLLPSRTYVGRDWNPWEKDAADEEAKIAHHSFKLKYGESSNVEIKFDYDSIRSRKLSHLSCITSKASHLMIISDEGLQYHKYEDESKISATQRTRAFSMFVLDDFFGLSEDIPSLNLDQEG